MVEENGNWNETPNIYVAFLDIMGFKDMVFRQNQDYVNNKLQVFNLFYQLLQNQNSIKSITFSDSIILVSRDDSLDSGLNMLTSVGWVMARSIHEKVPLKGAIAYGEQTADFKNNIHSGVPLIDAIELQEKLKIYGVILHHTMEARLIELTDIKNIKQLLQYPIPMGNNKINHYLINWTIYPRINEHLEKSVRELYKNVSGEPRKYIDNTMEFVQWVIEKKAELKQENNKKSV